MAPPQTGAGGLVGGRTQGAAKGLGEGSPGQGCQPLKACPPRGHSPRPWPAPPCRMDSGTATQTLVRSEGTLEPLQSHRWRLEGGAQARGWPAKRQMDSRTNRTHPITRYEDMAGAVVGRALTALHSGDGCVDMTRILFSYC